jgi:peptidoglycan/xylan/chitin deacetylase (PgdA/CDA1 family)
MSAILWTIGGLAAAGFSARWNWWRPAAPGVPVLMYHKIGDPPPGSKLGKLWVSTKAFRRQMEYLRKNGWTPITFLDVAAHLDEGAPVPAKPVVITFDDGYRNNYENAFPVLKEFGFKAVVFLVVNTLEGENAWHDPATETRIPMLSWKQIDEMRAAGVEFGSHTLSHPRLERLAPDAARGEIEESRRLLAARLGKAPVSFAYPYGNGADSPALQEMVRKAGYRWAVSVHQGKGDFKRAPFCLKRLFIRGDDTAWDFHLQMTRGKSRF